MLLPDFIADWVTTGLVVAAIYPVGGFIYFYMTKPRPGVRRWWRRTYSRRWQATSLGRTLLTQKWAWLAFLLFALANRIFDDWAGRALVAFVIYVSMVVLFWAVFLQLRETQRTTSEKEEEG